ncbi:MAG: M15 family metallopeptidase [Abditibacteriaceae bacterium]
MIKPDNDARRAYWTQQMDEAYEFMMRAMEAPVAECGELVASLEKAVGESDVKVLFSQSEIVPGMKRQFYLRKNLVSPFLNAAREFNQNGRIMIVEDGFRTTTMQKNVSLLPHVFDAVIKSCIWEYGDLPPTDLVRRRLAALTAAHPKNGTHMSASAIDISVQDISSGKEIDRGGPYIEMSELTPMESPFVEKAALENRLAIRQVMESNGFLAYPYEFWHFNQGDVYDEMLNKTGRPARYGAVHCDLETGEITPVESPMETLNSNAEIEQAMSDAYQRIGH